MKEISKKEEKLIELSEQKNPYAKECPNRHLWSEGFRSGYNYAKDKVVGLIKSDIESESNKDLQEADSAEEWFNGHFNCYADTWEDNYDTEPPTKVEGSVIPALTLGAFLEYARVKMPEDKNIESLVLKYIESELSSLDAEQEDSQGTEKITTLKFFNNKALDAGYFDEDNGDNFNYWLDFSDGII